jgi:hypothetical protein
MFLKHWLKEPTQKSYKTQPASPATILAGPWMIRVLSDLSERCFHPIQGPKMATRYVIICFFQGSGSPPSLLPP